MPSSPILKDICIEKIGILSTSTLQSELNPLFGSLPYAFTSIDSPDLFVTWVQAQRPRLVLLDAEIMEGAKKESLEKLRALLLQFGTLPLVLVQKLDSIPSWRELCGDNCHFFTGQDWTHLKQKITNILMERLLVESPGAAVISEKDTLLTSAQLSLRDHGFRVQTFLAPESMQSVLETWGQLPRLILWDWPQWKKNGHAFHRSLSDASLSILVLLETWPTVEVSEPGLKLPGVQMLSFDLLPEIIKKLSGDINKARDVGMNICRDSQTGLLSQNTFEDLCAREFDMACRYEDPFCIVRLQLQMATPTSDRETKLHRELVNNFGLFVQNRIRSSDLVAQIREGEIFVLLSRVGLEKAAFVGERLQTSFIQLVGDSFPRPESRPSLQFKVFSYPQDIKTAGHLAEIVQSKS